MRRRARHAGQVSHERWLVSYADFITLLFAFFVVMFASSQADKGRAKAVQDSVRGALESGGFTAAVREILGGTVDDKGKGNAMMRGPGGSQTNDRASPDPNVAELLPSLNYLSKELHEEIRGGQVQLSLQPRGLTVSLRQATFFPSGEDSIDPATYTSIDKIAAIVRELPNPVRLEGHTDSVPIRGGRFRSNWELSAARGIAMLELLATRCAVPREKMAIAGYAETAPVGSNESEEGRARNRRVDIVILAKHSLVTEPASVLERLNGQAPHAKKR